jgi:GT2 family glycosyltransferase
VVDEVDVESLDVGSSSLVASQVSNTGDAPIDGYVDFYGYHSLAGGWVFVGWVAHSGSRKDEFLDCIVHFLDGAVAQRVPVLFFSRTDLEGRGVGFVVFCVAEKKTNRAFQYLSVDLAESIFKIGLTHGVLPFSTNELIDRLRPILSRVGVGSQSGKMERLLSSVPQSASARGFIDFYGYHSVAGGWLFCGWVDPAWPAQKGPSQFIISFQGGDVTGAAQAILYPRGDLDGDAEGVVFFIRGPADALGPLNSLSFEVDGVRSVICPSRAAPKLREAELLAQLKSIVLQAPPGLQRERFLGVLGQQPYQGLDTLNDLRSPVLFCVDEAIVCGDAGLVLIGWSLFVSNEVTEAYVRTASHSVKFDIQNFIKVERRDVLEAFPQHGFSDSRCGFVGFIPIPIASDEKMYIEIHTGCNEIGYYNVKKPKLEGISAIKRLLEGFNFRFGAPQQDYDLVLGPAVRALNSARLSTRPSVEVSEYGAMPNDPKFSVIIPLYGRLDFIEYQLALFSNYSGNDQVEFIYVLDDPDRRVEAKILFASIYERTLVPFRAILLERNIGFAPANNIGLEYAHGTYIAYLNSDVFPGTSDWLERLSERLIEDPKLGVIGPLLLFEDGSIQHRGMYFKQLPEFGNWYFCMHQDKGLRFVGSRGVQPCASITGACMVLRRELAVQVGGFDETYVIGDFEDSDLCFKLRSLGLACAVDSEVELFHLERKSQLGSGVSWRMNLTLYNAWEHERRWASTIKEIQAQ